MTSFFAAASFGCVAFFGIVIARAFCREKVPFDDGPTPKQPPVLGLILAAAAFGAANALHGVPFDEMGVLAVVCGIFAAIWYTDVRLGLIPDAFTIAPLIVFCIYAAVRRDWTGIASATLAFAAFGATAAASGGRGIGWGDVKLAAFGGGLLGIETAALAFSAAGLLVGASALLRRRTVKPVAFAPYLISAMVVALWLPLLRG